MQYILMALFVAAVTVADQITKWLVVENIPLHGLHAPNRDNFVYCTEQFVLVLLQISHNESSGIKAYLRELL